jgi:hypothetical protein
LPATGLPRLVRLASVDIDLKLEATLVVLTERYVVARNDTARSTSIIYPAWPANADLSCTIASSLFCWPCSGLVDYDTKRAGILTSSRAYSLHIYKTATQTKTKKDAPIRQIQRKLHWTTVQPATATRSETRFKTGITPSFLQPHRPRAAAVAHAGPIALLCVHCELQHTLSD